MADAAAGKDAGLLPGRCKLWSLMMEDDLDRAPGSLETDLVEVRMLTTADLDWVVRIDEEYSRTRRTEYYRLKLKEAEQDTGIRVSLAARVDGEDAGFLMARLYYGEFGQPEGVAILDSIGVSRRHAGRKVAAALLRQLRMNLRGLGIEKVQTQIEWNHWGLLRFFERAGFRPAPRLCLELGIGS